MLILRRKVNQSIVIAGEIKVKVLVIGHGVVKIGIEAPGDIQAVRDELCINKQEGTNERAHIKAEP